LSIFGLSIVEWNSAHNHQSSIVNHQLSCRLAHECLIEYLRTTLDLPEGLPGIVMAIHTFGDL